MTIESDTPVEHLTDRNGDETENGEDTDKLQALIDSGEVSCGCPLPKVAGCNHDR